MQAMPTRQLATANFAPRCATEKIGSKVTGFNRKKMEADGRTDTTDRIIFPSNAVDKLFLQFLK